MKQEELRKIVSYDPATGVFRTIAKRGAAKAGGVIGYPEKKSGRIRISLNNVQFFAHRLAWVYEYGDIPKGLMIDHIDGDVKNNKISNLRLVNNSENMQNLHKVRSVTGLRGVQYCKDKDSYRAVIVLNGKRTFLGRYKDPDVAHAVYLEAKKKMHPFSHPETRRNLLNDEQIKHQQGLSNG